VRGRPTFSNFKHNLSLMAEFVGLSVSLIVSTVPSTNVRCDEPSKPDMFPPKVPPSGPPSLEPHEIAGCSGVFVQFTDVSVTNTKPYAHHHAAFDIL